MFEILHQTDLGYVGKCPCCDEIQFAIGNLVSHLPTKGFVALLRAMIRVCESGEMNIMDMPNGERLLLRTSADEIMLSLTPIEFLDTIELFEQANLALEVSKAFTKSMN
jgi:hypothetical protein